MGKIAFDRIGRTGGRCRRCQKKRIGSLATARCRPFIRRSIFQSATIQKIKIPVRHQRPTGKEKGKSDEKAKIGRSGLHDASYHPGVQRVCDKSAGCRTEADAGWKNYSSGWLGLEVAYKTKGLSAGHTIVKIPEGTPAFKSGLRAGDEIWFIDQDNAGYMNTYEVAKRLAQADRQVVLQVKRKG